NGSEAELIEVPEEALCPAKGVEYRMAFWRSVESQLCRASRNYHVDTPRWKDPRTSPGKSAASCLLLPRYGRVRWPRRNNRRPSFSIAAAEPSYSKRTRP